MTVSRQADTLRRADAPRSSNETAVCRVPGCGGYLRFYTIEYGRVVDVCTECERRIAYVKALEAAIRKSRDVVALPGLGAAVIKPTRQRFATRKGVVTLLARSPNLTVTGMVERLSATRTAITQHLFHLRRAKMLIAELDPKYGGRGFRCTYRLSAKALRRFKAA